MNNDFYLAYSSELPTFIKVKALTEKEAEQIADTLHKKMASKGWGLNEYLRFIVNLLVMEIDVHKKSISSDDGLYECLFPAVLEIHPMFSVDSICDLVNSCKNKAGKVEVATVTKPKANRGKSLKTNIQNIKKSVIGQDEPLDTIHSLLKLKESGLESFVSMFFIGPTGVGKTETARKLASEYLGDPSRLIKINCAELASQHEYSRLIGSPPGYIGSSEKSLLQEKSEQSSEWIFLFDEFEKAHPKIHTFLLGLLDDGLIMDNHSRLLDFSKSVFIFTTNVGVSEAYDKISIGFSDGKQEGKAKSIIEKEFEQSFPTEFRNRLNEVIFFNQLTKQDAYEIAKIHLADVPVNKTAKLIKYIVENSFSPKFGARNIKRFISKTIKLPIADKILNGEESTQYKVVFDGSSLQSIG